VSETISRNTTIAQYTILSKIAQGGMGEVYRAPDSKLGRDVAINVLPATLSENVDPLNRFEQEAKAAGALNHPKFSASITSADIKGAIHHFRTLGKRNTARSTGRWRTTATQSD
jgi:serine/threonine protein kinase